MFLKSYIDIDLKEKAASCSERAFRDDIPSKQNIKNQFSYIPSVIISKESVSKVLLLFHFIFVYNLNSRFYNMPPELEMIYQR